MQDDITAGVEHLVKQDISDPARVCIVAASYGGYAALRGLVKPPKLYRCGMSFTGVTDIAHMLDFLAKHLGEPAATEEASAAASSK